MKAWLVYWCIGCAVVGLPLGNIMRECPNTDIRPIFLVGSIATWPAIIFASFTRGRVEQQSKCPA